MKYIKRKVVLKLNTDSLHMKHALMNEKKGNTLFLAILEVQMFAITTH